MFLHILKIFSIAFLFAYFVQGFGFLIINYDIRDKKIRILLFGFIPVFKIAIDDNLEINEINLIQRLKPELNRSNLCNKLFGRTLQLKRKTGLLRNILITPRDVPSFMRAYNYALKGIES